MPACQLTSCSPLTCNTAVACPPAPTAQQCRHRSLADSCQVGTGQVAAAARQAGQSCARVPAPTYCSAYAGCAPFALNIQEQSAVLCCLHRKSQCERIMAKPDLPNHTNVGKYLPLLYPPVFRLPLLVLSFPPACIKVV